MKRAGDVNGTPEWQKVEEIKEVDFSTAWHASISLTLGMIDFKETLSAIEDGMRALEGHPDYYKLASIHDELTDIKCACTEIRDKYLDIIKNSPRPKDNGEVIEGLNLQLPT